MYNLHVGSQGGAEMRKRRKRAERKGILRAKKPSSIFTPQHARNVGKMQASDDFWVYEREQTLQ